MISLIWALVVACSILPQHQAAHHPVGGMLTGVVVAAKGKPMQTSLDIVMPQYFGQAPNGVRWMEKDSTGHEVERVAEDGGPFPAGEEVNRILDIDLKTFKTQGAQFSRSVKTDKLGRFTLTKLKAGLYVITPKSGNAILEVARISADRGREVTITMGPRVVK